MIKTEYFTNNQAIHILFYSSQKIFQNTSYFRTQNKSQQIQENQNNLLYHIRPQHNKTRHQQQKKLLKHMMTEQCTPEKTLGD
jgi:hypothetical protein